MIKTTHRDVFTALAANVKRWLQRRVVRVVVVGLMRWLFLSFGLLLLAFALLTVVRAWNTTVWKMAIIAGEYGHYFGLLGIVVICGIVAHATVMESGGGKLHWWLSGGAVVTTLAATVLLFSPSVLAAMIGQRLPAKLAAAFGGRPARSQVVDFGEMFWRRPAVIEVPSTSHVFAHTGTADALALEFYRPRDPAARNFPCVVVVHGGGWDSGDNTQLAEFNHWLAGQGYGVAAISYRLAPAHPWPAQREDTLAAIDWLKTHASELGLDPTRLVLMGRSAGAQIASAVAYGVPDPAVRGVIGLYGVYDMAFVWSISREDDVLNSVKLMNQYLGGEPTATNQAAYDSASAQGLVDPRQTPPTLLMHGTIDTLCWVKHSQRLSARLQEAGVPQALIELPWAVHAFDYNLHGPGGQLTTYAVASFLAAAVGGENQLDR
ncbi:alpha/beta hydrolase [Synoicihabitans lomoniglobus]|uniref:Alpha/beta hydrolase n=1 Tax=Synoicihabitans lomoniglobus TaxID=2909285 RepID=A0AAF0CNJ8_9BACT|nr:alpha/beta hydrolase [Opitutaceae bacterium LMO-M01]WED64626.1 alpha/beta hydrolase [Opitutaceae bacterium LMO-M01]